MSRITRPLLLAGVILPALPATAQSTTGTLAGTTISNTAQASYTVNGTAATTTSNTATFVVDRKVNLTVVTTQTGNTQVNLGQTGAVLTFRVTNATNGTQDFLLAANQLVPSGIITGSDDFDATNVHLYADANGNGIYDPGVDTQSWIDELAPDASRAIFIVADVPTTAGITLAQVGLQVTAAAGGAGGVQGAALVPTDLNVINADATVDIVFADNDNDGVLGYDIARNGQGWAYAAYEVGTRSLNLSVVKSASIVSDGVNTLNPKALPGAVVQYCLTATNATLTTPATNLTLSDVIPANTTYVPGSITVGGIGAAGVCIATGQAVSDDGSSTGVYSGGFDAASKTVTARIPLLPGGGSIATSFRVKIN